MANKGPKPKYETYEQIRQARNEAQHRYYEWFCA